MRTRTSRSAWSTVRLTLLPPLAAILASLLGWRLPTAAQSTPSQAEPPGGRLAIRPFELSDNIREIVFEADIRQTSPLFGYFRSLPVVGWQLHCHVRHGADGSVDLTVNEDGRPIYELRVRPDPAEAEFLLVHERDCLKNIELDSRVSRYEYYVQEGARRDLVLAEAGHINACRFGFLASSWLVKDWRVRKWIREGLPFNIIEIAPETSLPIKWTTRYTGELDGIIRKRVYRYQKVELFCSSTRPALPAGSPKKGE